MCFYCVQWACIAWQNDRSSSFMNSRPAQIFISVHTWMLNHKFRSKELIKCNASVLSLVPLYCNSYSSWPRLTLGLITDNDFMDISCLYTCASFFLTSGLLLPYLNTSIFALLFLFLGLHWSTYDFLYGLQVFIRHCFDVYYGLFTSIWFIASRSLAVSLSVSERDDLLSIYGDSLGSDGAIFKKKSSRALAISF